jgi:amidophosphoribosyltransferase
MVKRGSIFQASSDTEVIPHLMATHLRGNVVDRLINALHQVEGAYSLVASPRTW